MGRKKVEMGLIESKKTRMRTFTNRKTGIMKKASELSKLCDVDVGVIIFGPNGEKPHVWPEEPQQLKKVLWRYQTTSKEERQKRATILSSSSSYTETDAQNIDFVHNYTGNDPTWDDQVDSFSAEQLVELINCLDSKLGIVKQRIDMVKLSQDLTHSEDLQSFSCSSQEQGVMMAMNPGMEPSNFQWQYQPDHDHHQYVAEERSAEEAMMMMMMMNGGGYCNPTNGYVGDFSGFMGMDMNGKDQNHYSEKRENENGEGMWNPSPLAWYYAPLTQLQQEPTQLQVQPLNDGQLPLY